MGLAYNENYLVFKWVNDDCKILFSVSRRGNAASCHFSSDKPGLRRLRQAISEFCDFIFYLFDWCTMVLAFIERPSVCRIVKRLGFSEVAGNGNTKVYARGREWAA